MQHSPLELPKVAAESDLNGALCCAGHLQRQTSAFLLFWWAEACSCGLSVKLLDDRQAVATIAESDFVWSTELEGSTYRLLLLQA